MSPSPASSPRALPTRPVIEDPSVSFEIDPREVFVSYKREDEARVSRLVQALERHGFVVWWDRGLVAGENWRARIDAHLEKAGAVVVCWTRRTAGSEGRFVQAEADRALRLGKLLPVLLDPVAQPAAFADVPAIDLSHWARGVRASLSGGRLGGSHRDLFVRDLVEALHARLDGQPAPAPKAYRRRLQRRIAWGSLATATAAFATAFATNTMGLQQQACSLPWGQPALADACGAYGLGGQPSQDERLAWAARPREPKASCEGLRSFLQQHPKGVHAATAQALLAARKTVVEQRWTPTERPLPVREAASAQPDREGAEQATLDAARLSAEKACKALEGQGLVRVRSTTLEPQLWDCHPQPGRGKQPWVCAVDGVTRCVVEEGVEVKSEVCE